MLKPFHGYGSAYQYQHSVEFTCGTDMIFITGHTVSLRCLNTKHKFKMLQDDVKYALRALVIKVLMLNTQHLYTCMYAKIHYNI